MIGRVRRQDLCRKVERAKRAVINARLDLLSFCNSSSSPVKFTPLFYHDQYVSGPHAVITSLF